VMAREEESPHPGTQLKASYSLRPQLTASYSLRPHTA
jgi:hypothetical protein